MNEVVLGGGVEPPRLAAYAPQTYVSAISPPEHEDGGLPSVFPSPLFTPVSLGMQAARMGPYLRSGRFGLGFALAKVAGLVLWIGVMIQRSRWGRCAVGAAGRRALGEIGIFPVFFAIMLLGGCNERDLSQRQPSAAGPGGDAARAQGENPMERLAPAEQPAPDSLEAYQREQIEKFRQESSIVESEELDSFLKKLRVAIAVRDKQTMATLMTPNFGYSLDPILQGPGVFDYWEQNDIWAELDGVMWSNFVPFGGYMVAPPEFGDPNSTYSGYRAGVRKLNGKWRFAYFVKG